jgi:hypothetical protein
LYNTDRAHENEYVLIRKSKGKKPVGRPRSGQVDNTKTDLKEMVRIWTGLIWLRPYGIIHLRDGLNTVTNFLVP